MAKWYSITNKGGGIADIKIYGEITDLKFWDDDVTPTEFQEELDALGDLEQLNVFINSPGGSVFAGFTIYNILKRNSAKVMTQVDGLAASIASVIFEAGDERVMATNGMLMIHNPMVGIFGYAEDLRKYADLLDKISGPIRGSYTNRTKVSDDEVRKMMDAETWMTAEEAVEMGFADSVDADQFAAAAVDDSNLVVNGMSFAMANFRNFQASKFVLAPQTSQLQNRKPAAPKDVAPADPKEPPATDDISDPVDYSEYEAAVQETEAALEQA